MPKVHEKINALMNEINLGFTPSSPAEQLQMSDVVEELMEAADKARRDTAEWAARLPRGGKY